MSQGTEFPLEIARLQAQNCANDLLPVCKEVQIVGSVRRNKPIVHDIEILVIPTVIPDFDLFGGVCGDISKLELDLPRLVYKWGARIITDGPKLKKMVLPGGLPLEICVSSPERWGVETVIKTGPAEFSHKCVTARKDGGYLPSYCQIKNGWQVYHRDGKLLLEMPSERAFLEFVGLGWVEPGDRH